jgi:hypothetical protein
MARAHSFPPRSDWSASAGGSGLRGRNFENQTSDDFRRTKSYAQKSKFSDASGEISCATRSARKCSISHNRLTDFQRSREHIQITAMVMFQTVHLFGIALRD